MKAATSFLDPGRNCWRIERADRAAMVIDACDYFRLAREAMLRARSQILLVGWDFDTRIFLDEKQDHGAPVELGPLVSWLAKHRPGLSIHILSWDWGAAKLLGRGTTIFRLARWTMSKQISFKMDSAHPTGASHHQKIMVVDDKLAFCGGIDMTATRWDTRAHLDEDPRRRQPTRGGLYPPWHDAAMAVDGEAARAFGELARERWSIAGGRPIAPPEAEADPWPRELEPGFRNVDVAISRTRAEHGELPPAREIEAMFLDMIAAARHFVYAEDQFFASRAIAEAIARRLGEPEGPEIVIINPKTVRGWLAEETMSPARAELVKLLSEADLDDRFRIYTPVTRDGAEIYVHSKITIIDGQILRVGSANLNNRSMGLDSECDLTLDSRSGQNRSAERQIAGTMADLLAEHLDVDRERVDDSLSTTASVIATIEALRGPGRSLVPLVIEAPNSLESGIADKELLDPESAGGASEPARRPGLLDGVRRIVRRRRD